MNAVATILFTVTLIAMGFTVLQQRRAERMAAIRPQQEDEDVMGTAPVPPAPGGAGGWVRSRAPASAKEVAMESASATVPAGSEPGGKGLKADAIGYLTNLVISVASVAPAYSLAATLGFIVAIDGMGVHAPAVMIVSFIPMLLIAAAYNYMNRADPDCGTSFTWVTRAMGPRWAGSPAGRSSSRTWSSWRRSPTSPASTPSCWSSGTAPPTRCSR